jgi:hypothetical protein
MDPDKGLKELKSTLDKQEKHDIEVIKTTGTKC